MKIHSIHFKNINSLAGEHQISFEEPPFVDVGVFAITGPNGSGKTTILDAITLGMYGETYKFDRPAYHVMTKHTDDCFAEVIFTTNNEKYRSFWRAARSGAETNAESIAPEMKLWRLGEQEELLEDRSNKVRAKIAELTGMDFRRFTRAIILSQGDFDAFLNALDSERMDMLENIISGDVYTDYKNNVFQKAAEEKNKLEQLKQELSEIVLFDASRKEAYEADLADFVEQYNELRDEKNVLQEHTSWLQNIEAVKVHIETLENQTREVNKQIEQKQALLAKIMANSEMLSYQDDVEKIDQLQQELDEQQRVLNSHQDEIKHLKNQLLALGGDAQADLPFSGVSFEKQEQSIETLKFQIGEIQLGQQSENKLLGSLKIRHQQQDYELMNVKAWLEEHQADRSLVRGFPELDKLSTLKAELGSLKEKKDSLGKWKKTTGSLLEKNKSGLGKIKKNIKQLQHKKLTMEKKLEELLEGRLAGDILDLLEEQQDRIVQFRDLLNLAIEYQALDTKKSEGLFSSGPKALDVEALNEAVNKLSEEFVREQNIKSALDKAVFHEGWVLKHEKERAYLEPGQPCPLCGSIHHPYVLQPPVHTDSKRALLDQTRKVKTIQAELEKLKKQLAQAQRLAEIQAEKERRMKTIRSRWHTQCNRLNVVIDNLDIDNIRLIKKLLRDATEDLSAIASLEKEVKGLQLKIASTGDLIESQQALLEQMRGRTEQLEADWKKIPQELTEIEEEYARCESEFKVLANKIDEQLTSLGEQMPEAGTEEELIERLKTRLQEYRVHEQQQEDLKDELIKLSEKAKLSQNEIMDLDKRLERCKNQLRNEEVTQLQLVIQEKQKQLADEVSQSEALQAEWAQLRQSLLERLATTEFKTLEALREILALIARRAEVESNLAALESEASGLKTQTASENARLEAELALSKTESSIEEIAAQQRSVAEKMDITDQEIKHLENVLAEEKQRQQHHDTLTEHLEQQQQVYQQCEADISKINENGGAFRLSVQQMMADRLLEKANYFLNKISGRYRVYKKASEHGLALEIEDSYLRNIRRLPKTLSGGESFIVSLSLALSLSEQANNGKSVDSLFLDEGFGYLDDESLYMVMTTLKSLKAHGKTVGVISHVKGVMDRIDTRIELKKGINGLSSFELLS